MYFRRKNRNRIIIIAVVALLFIYWRGTKAITKERALDCKYHIVYAVCKQSGKATPVPGFFDVLKAGIKF